MQGQWQNSSGYEGRTAPIRTLSLDLETYSSENLTKCGVYRYAEAPDFEILLFGYSADGAPVKVVDLTAGETLPADVFSALTDPAVTKWAFNAQFERVCLSRYLGYPNGQYLDPSSWHCTMVWAATLGLPLSLEGVGAVLGLEKQKLKRGKDLIRYFCTPAKAKDGGLIRRYPADAPEKWELFKAYNLRDVETEMAIQQKLSRFPVTESEWRNYTLDQQINDRGIMLDRTFVTQTICCDERFKRTHMEQARSVTGLDNPNSPVQLKAWLAEKGVKSDSLSKAAVTEMLEKADGEVELALSLRQELAKSSVRKYTAIPNAGATLAVCALEENHGLESAVKQAAAEIWQQRNDFVFESDRLEPAQAICRAQSVAKGLVFIADSGDNVTNGAVGDNAYMLDCVIKSGAHRVLITPICDERAVKACAETGSGRNVTVTIGGQNDSNSRQVTVTGRVKHLKRDRLGYVTGCVLALENEVDVMLSKERQGITKPEEIEDYNVYLGAYQMIVIKLGYLLECFMQYAADSMMALSPGNTMLDLGQLPYRRLRRPIAPLDAVEDFEPVYEKY